MNKYFLDCGAYKGSSVKKFIELYKDYKDYNIICFEPNIYFCNFIKRRYDFVETIQKACWNKDCVMTFKHGTGKFSNGSSLIFEKKIRGHWSCGDILCIDFSKWIATNLKPNDHIVCKLNIEGAEYKVLEKMISDGTDKYINKFYIDWHWTKCNMSKKNHLKISSQVDSVPWDNLYE
jgi:FkbM family methyltransferase